MSLKLRALFRMLVATWCVLGIALLIALNPARVTLVSAAPASVTWPLITLTPVITGTTQPLFVTDAGDFSGRLFVVEKGGTIRVFKNGHLLSTPFLSITNQVTTNSERGLLGLAFPPNYVSEGHFYIYYTDLNGNLVLARYFVSANPDVADSAHGKILLTIPHPGQSNHNGGDIMFGPNDGYLYAGTGDGGSANDPPNNAQTHNVLLGKMLRLDVEAQTVTTYTDAFTYSIPATNPFTQSAGYRPEIWALGLRNPWRYSFDRANGDLYIGDVGQDCYEEVDYRPYTSTGGENYGWRLEEAIYQFSTLTPTNCAKPLSTLVTTTKPITTYGHNVGADVIGGYVYRGKSFYPMFGIYFYGDNTSNRVWGLKHDNGSWVGAQLTVATGAGISSFGQDQYGNLYLTGLSDGTVYELKSTSINFIPSIFHDSP